MGGEKLWWTWGMAGHSTGSNKSLVVYSTYEIWNDTINPELFNETRNLTCPTTASDRDFIIGIVVAAILSLVILITVVGKSLIINLYLFFTIYLITAFNYLPTFIFYSQCEP